MVAILTLPLSYEGMGPLLRTLITFNPGMDK